MSRDRARWASLTPEQHAVAKDLLRRAEALCDAAPELTRAEAIDIAAIQYGCAEGNSRPPFDGTPEEVPNNFESRTP